MSFVHSSPYPLCRSASDGTTLHVTGGVYCTRQSALAGRRTQQVRSHLVSSKHVRFLERSGIGTAGLSKSSAGCEVIVPKRYILPAKVSLPHVQAWVDKTRPTQVDYEGCKDFKCTACDKILTTIAGSGSGSLRGLHVRLNCTEHMSPQRVLTALATASARDLVRLSLKTGQRSCGCNSGHLLLGAQVNDGAIPSRADDLYTISMRSLEAVEKLAGLQVLELSHGRTCARIETIPPTWAAFRSLRKLKVEGGLIGLLYS